ncbi:hypothetical protein FWC31_02125 [Candidatus Saccharibacteria bacterium]|nr:hypothetical protein [Candidatus Saccharibacteria bacterium]
MSERKVTDAKADPFSTNSRYQCLVDPLGDQPDDGGLVGAGHCSQLASGLACLEEQKLVRPEKSVIRLNNNQKRRRVGRPASSNDVRLTPKYHDPIDVARLGKALAAIALKQAGIVQAESARAFTEADGGSHGKNE